VSQGLKVCQLKKLSQRQFYLSLKTTMKELSENFEEGNLQRKESNVIQKFENQILLILKGRKYLDNRRDCQRLKLLQTNHH